MSLSIDEHKVEEKRKFAAFDGEGVRLNGRSLSYASPLDTTNIANTHDADDIQALRLPPTKLWFGYEVKILSDVVVPMEVA